MDSWSSLVVLEYHTLAYRRQLVSFLVSASRTYQYYNRSKSLWNAPNWGNPQLEDDIPFEPIAERFQCIGRWKLTHIKGKRKLLGWFVADNWITIWKQCTDCCMMTKEITKTGALLGVYTYPMKLTKNISIIR